MDIYQNFFTVEVERLYEDTTTKSGIILLNSAYVDESDMDRYEHKRLYGTVVGVPASFSNEAVRPIDEGVPHYRKFVGHDDIVDRINRGYRNHAEKSYCPSTFDEYPVITMADIAKDVDVRVGDKIYFTPQSTEPENMIEKKTDGKMLFIVAVNEIWCKIDDGKVKMQGEWVLVKPDMETWEEITTKAGIIKKSKPEAKWLRGVVTHSRHTHLKEGSTIVYLPNADCDVTIEGERMFVMPAQDIIGELKDIVAT